ncbi:hypothetical protein K7432_015092 [Basidiobolus ranarum]|uniref:Eukaryotic translation initiation factor 3 subunit K n=1 Tax=Basidiobolus ranarum TaxID=34480 RepID=A0ABR2WGN5_9FUNG
MNSSIRPENIEKIINSVERYNPENLPALEKYLALQCSGQEHDLMANLAILKMYQFNPQLVNHQIVCSILIKALTAIPNSDFNLCLYLLNEQIISEASVAKVVSLHKILEEARYEEFWSKIGSDSDYKELLSDVVSFEKEIRTMIAKNIAITYQVVSLKHLEGYLNIKGQELENFVKEQGWTKQEENVTIPLNKDNEAKQIVITENIKFEQLTKILCHSSA